MIHIAVTYFAVPEKLNRIQGVDVLLSRRLPTALWQKEEKHKEEAVLFQASDAVSSQFCCFVSSWLTATKDPVSASSWCCNEPHRLPLRSFSGCFQMSRMTMFSAKTDVGEKTNFFHRNFQPSPSFVYLNALHSAVVIEFRCVFNMHSAVSVWLIKTSVVRFWVAACWEFMNVCS